MAREIDRLSIADYGIPGQRLMTEAGEAVALRTMALWKPGDKLLILAGPGNNGGDALVAARSLRNKGFEPTVLDVRAQNSSETADRKIQRELYETLGSALVPYQENLNLGPWQDTCFVVDGLLGLGLREPLRAGHFRSCLEHVASLRPRRVLAIDLPSGLLADVWQQQPPPLLATHCLSFGAAKPAHLLQPSRMYCGTLQVVPLGFHSEAIVRCETSATAQLMHDRLYLPRKNPWHDLPANAHKFTRGLVLVIGGSSGKLGAPLLTAEASLRAGAGWSSVALLSQEHCPALPRHLTYEDLGDESGLQLEKIRTLLDQRPVKALVIGPGTIRNPLDSAILQELAKRQRQSRLFLVFDAAALSDWAALAKGCEFDPSLTLLTPHPGEWRRVGAFAKDLNDLDCLSVAWNFCQEFGVTVFYKSASPFSLSSTAAPILLVNTDGDQALAKAGSGDILAGIAAAFGCAGLSATVAANWAQRCLAQAAAMATQEFSRDGLSPEDLLRFIPFAVKNPASRSLS